MSHSSRDARLIARIVELLQEAFVGLSIRCSSIAGMGLPPGAPIADQVVEDIQQARAFLVVLSRSSLRSQFVQQEVGIRLAVQKPILPLLVHGLGAEKVRGPLADLKKARFLHCDQIGDLFALIDDLANKIERVPCCPSVFAPRADSLARLGRTTVQKVMKISLPLIPLLLMGSGSQKGKIVFVRTPPPPPALQVTRIDGQEVQELQGLRVSPAGSIEGSIQPSAETYPVKVTTSANGRSWEPTDLSRFPVGPWTLQNVRFREPGNLEEAIVKVTVDVGTPPALVSHSLDVIVPAPVVTIERVCGQRLDSFRQGCERFKVEGSADNVLESEERIWVEVINDDENGSFHAKECFLADIRNGQWTLNRSWPSQDLQGSYRLRFGLVAGPTSGHDCPAGLKSLDQIDLSASGTGGGPG